MSMRLEMLQVARLAPRLLGESTGLVTGFLQRQQNDDGGFKDRTGKSDLYYTVFGLDGLLALQVEPRWDRVAEYLRPFGYGETLDFVHLCCLARCWAAVNHDVAKRPGQSSPCPLPAPGAETMADTSRRSAAEAEGPVREASWSGILQRIESFRATDGGYHPVAGSPRGTAYAAFLALGAYQDLQAVLPEPIRLVRSLKILETGDGAWSNEPGTSTGSTNATAAVVTLLRNLAVPVRSSIADWLLARCHPAGGFLAAPQAPIPDLLSTATALHALAGMQRSFGPIKEKCLDFIDTLWTNDGAFHGQWADDHPDCEYTYYGLLALGHLSL